MKKILKNNIVIMCLTFFIPGIFALISKDSFSIYKSLVRPKLSPPAYIFPIVWSILYILMSISYILVKNEDEYDNKSLYIYYVQLLLNAIWTPLFFLFRNYKLAFIDILILLFVIFYMTYKFNSNNKLAAYLLYPYIIWTIFASYLNLYVMIHN